MNQAPDYLKHVPPALSVGWGALAGAPWILIALLVLFFYGAPAVNRWIAVYRNARALPGSADRLTVDQAIGPPTLEIATVSEIQPPGDEKAA